MAFSPVHGLLLTCNAERAWHLMGLRETCGCQASMLRSCCDASVVHARSLPSYGTAQQPELLRGLSRCACGTCRQGACCTSTMTTGTASQQWPGSPVAGALCPPPLTGA